MPETSRTLGDLETMLMLRRVPMFQDLDPEDLQRIAMTAVEHLYPADEPIVREGDVGDELVVIVEGSVRVVRLEPDGTERLIRGYEAGDHIGELAVLREAPRAATVIAKGDGVRGLRHRRRKPPGDPARTSRRGHGDAGDPRRADQHAVALPPMAEAPQARRPLPTGTVTFLRTDVEGSMRLARALGPTWDAINELHLGILRDAVDRHGGVCVRTEGDAMFAAFPEAGAAVLAAIDGQRALLAHGWPEDGAVRVRMGVHTGEAHLAGDDYGGFDVSRAARIAAVGHGGQIIVSGDDARPRRVESAVRAWHSANSAGTRSGTCRPRSTCSRSTCPAGARLPAAARRRRPAAGTCRSA